MPNTYTSDQAIEFALLTLVIGRESRGETFAAMLGVAWSIRNRVEQPRWWGHDWISVITKPYQYSSIAPPAKDNDPNLRVYPDLDAPAWRLVLEAAEAAYWAGTPDPVHGATHYYDRSLDDNPPSWATDGSSEHICDLGDLHFYRAH